MAKSDHYRKKFVKEFHKTQQKDVSRWQGLAFPNIWLLTAWMTLIVVGLIMLGSASISESVQIHKADFYFVWRQLMFYGCAIIASYIVFSLGTKFFFEYANLILLLSLLLLLLLYAPGVGYTVNGSRRWLNLGVVHLQVGEFIKMSLIIFTAAYLKKWDYKLDRMWRPIVILLFIISIFSLLLLLQPDFGTTAVLLVTILGMLFLSGVALWRFLIVAFIGGLSLAGIAILEPYRVTRLMTFLDPWQHQYDEGYQLVNSLISFGRGGLFGVGLGEGVQKYQYLPEAHTDFIFSVIAEETGLVGGLFVMGIYGIIVWKAFAIGRLADQVRNRFSRNLAYGIGLWLGIQVLINIGVTSGVLPTKGLTLPLISYGGSSVVMTCMALALLARIDSESRFQAKREGKL